jgi:hypothetical protein
MTRLRVSLMVTGFLAAFALPAQTGPDPAENSFQFFVDGVLTAGVVGYGIEFNHDPQSRTDSRRLDTVYSPDQRRFVITVTQKGLNRLMEWINSATSTGTPTTKNITIVARDNQQNVLARWELTGVTPATFSSQGQGVLTQVTATVEFAYSTMTLVQAKPD